VNKSADFATRRELSISIAAESLPAQSPVDPLLTQTIRDSDQLRSAGKLRRSHRPQQRFIIGRIEGELSIRPEIMVRI
jgi:hypothetical protein